MSDNPQVPSDAYFALGFGVLALSGPDAVKFAHAQFMSDVAGLPAGHWQWSGWLTPKGRVIALFALLRPDDGGVWLLLPDADAAELASQLRRFVFRAKVAVEPRADLVVAGAYAAPARAREAVLGRDDAQGLELDFSGEGGARSVRIAPRPAREDAGLLARWKRFDLEHGLPRLDPSQRGQWTPQMLSLERLRAFSVKKGCYPGQEIVARTHFLGQAKRGLALLDTDAAPAPGDEVARDGAPLGAIVSTAAGPGTSLALAVLPLDHGTGPLHAGAASLRERPLRGGLAR